MQQAEPSTLLLCAGRLSHVAVPMALSASNAMLPIGGRPVIAWTLDALREQGVGSVTIVARQDDDELPAFVEQVYGNRVRATIARVPAEGGSIVHSLAAGLRATPGNGPVRLLLGDTLVNDPLDAAPDFVYAAPVPHPQRWCVVRTDGDGRIDSLHDKQPLPGHDHMALVGYYRFDDGDVLRAAVADAEQRQARELSAVLLGYGARRGGMAVLPAARWHDFGNVDSLAKARFELLQPREFNHVRIDRAVHSITKRSRDGAKLRAEAAWFEALPPALRLLAPRLIDSGEDGSRADGPWAYYTLEYYGYPTLAELYVCGRILPEIWDAILRRVLDVQALFAAHPGALVPGAARTMYGSKTRERLAALQRQHPEWRWLFAESVELDGRTVPGIPAVLRALDPWVDHLEATLTPGICHGDLCFSNVLFDVGSQIVRVIDPRGSFGEVSLYGDPRYDLAKMRHSVCGWYDFIVAGYVHVRQLDEAAFALDWNVPETARTTAEFFDELLEERGLPAREIHLIEALLFLTMAPLHNDVPSRQRVMALHGLRLFDEATRDAAPEIRAG